MTKHVFNIHDLQPTLPAVQGELDRHSPIPLYHQLKEILRSQIENNHWKAGDLFPNENQIVQEYGLSRGTVREAMEELVREGLLTRHRGRGTFVAMPKYEQDMFHFFSVHEYTKQTGHKPGSEILSFNVEKADSKVASQLGLADGEQVYKIVRIRTIDGEPTMYDQVFLSARDFPNLQEKDLASRSLYEILTNDYATPLGKAKQTFEPVLINQQESRLFKVEKGMAAMLIERTTYRMNSTPVVYSKIVIRGDRCKFSAEISMR